MTTLDSAAHSRKATRAVLKDALGVFPFFSSSTDQMDLSCWLNPIPIEEVLWMISHCQL